MTETNSGQIEQPQPPESFSELKNPDFRTGNFVMHLTSNPAGLEIATDKSLPRKEGELPLDEEQREKLKEDMSGEMRFTGGVDAAEALNQLREGAGSNESFEETRQKYVFEGNKTKVGIRNIRREGDRILIDIKPVAFPVYSSFSKPELSAEHRNFAEAAATCMSIITSDGKLLIQHRSETNALYGDMPGASIAGYFDGEFDRDAKTKGKLKKIGAAEVLANVRKEAREEMGIETGDFSDNPTLIGLCEELGPQTHHEFLFMANTTLTSEQIRNKALNTARARKKELKPEDIEEKFDFIDATPEAIFTLLSEVKCPLPPTHAAVFAATAYELVLKRDGKETADWFKSQLEQGIKTNYETIDKMVRSFYANTEGAIDQIPDRLMRRVEVAVKSFKDKNPSATDAEIIDVKEKAINQLPKRNPNGYTPAYLPKEQGLPEYDEALKEQGLIAIENLPNLEDEKTANRFPL